MLQRVLYVGLPLALVAVLVSPGTTPARYEENEGLHRALRATVYHLKEARQEIKAVEFAKHRERVERDINVAIREIEEALREAKIDIAYVPTGDWRSKWKSFHNLHQALVELDIAESDLPKVTAGWAKKKELREAIHDARAHVKEALDEIK